MKVVAILVGLCLIGVIRSETCSGNTGLDQQCSHLTCDQGWHLACVSGQCTCEQDSGMTCTSLQDCLDMQNWDCPDNRRHCIDGTCRCTRWSIGK